MPVASEAFLVELLVLVDAVDGVGRYGSNALGARVFTARRMRRRRSLSIREVVGLLGQHGAFVALVGHLGAVRANEAVRGLMELSALWYDPVTLIINQKKKNS